MRTDGRMDDQRHDEDNTRDYAKGPKLLLYILNPKHILLGSRGSLGSSSDPPCCYPK